MNYLVIVMCAVHMGSRCPIPKGATQEHQFTSKTECEKTAKSYIAAFGYVAADFHVVCREK